MISALETSKSSSHLTFREQLIHSPTPTMSLGGRFGRTDLMEGGPPINT